jgi:ribonuclease Z
MNVKTRLGGGKSGDPSLYIDLVDRKRGILFDCGLNYFRHAQLRKVSDVFISHTHIDHFIGFDTLLRLNLAEDKRIDVYGPPGITQNVIGKLHAYTWNICQNLRLIIAVHEVLPEKILLTELESWRGFAVNPPAERPHSDVLLRDFDFSVKFLELDHKTPSFAYSFREADSCNVRKDTMQAMGLEPGRWVADLKSSAFQEGGGGRMLDIHGTAYRLDELMEKLLVRKQGCKISYLTDFLFDDKRLEEIRRFAWESDLFFCEAAFSEAERDKAKFTHHLTAREAGKLAQLAQVKQLILFHFSKRYQDYSLLINEAKNEFPFVE